MISRGVTAAAATNLRIERDQAERAELIFAPEACSLVASLAVVYMTVAGRAPLATLMVVMSDRIECARCPGPIHRSRSSCAP
ncbi:hypothetical protein QV13_15015 [Mesorhizobium hungaricum]|uniref:Uncharacterized protein n=1 Tax=Mesorhizobium hungaricum TaxID=1566387 RepID=A0A1C2DN27_9HYPH|nr:hypothetical protein QV13_15015 [Mesorhizobium hungaricum]